MSNTFMMVEEAYGEINTLELGVRDSVLLDKGIIPRPFINEIVEDNNYVLVGRFIVKNNTVLNRIKERGIDLNVEDEITMKSLGLILGYPPKAVSYFIGDDYRNRNNSCVVNFGGMKFVTGEDILVDDLRYLFRHSLPNDLSGFVCSVEYISTGEVVKVLYSTIVNKFVKVV